MNNNIKEHPIQFEADMIRALLQEYSTPGEHKNQTRRTCGLNQFNDLPEALKERGWEIQEFIEESGSWLAVSEEGSGKFSDIFIPWIECPYGKVGDRLWVQEEICHNSRSGCFILLMAFVCQCHIQTDGYQKMPAGSLFLRSTCRVGLPGFYWKLRKSELSGFWTLRRTMHGWRALNVFGTMKKRMPVYGGITRENLRGWLLPGYLSSLCGKK